MDESWKNSFEKVRAEAQVLKEQAFNRHDEAFAPWHRKARSVLLQFAAVKIPAFDEIRFASDYFLSQPDTEQDSINDRIALVADLDLALDIFDQAFTKIEDELRYKKRRGNMGKMSIEPPPVVISPDEKPAGWEDVPADTSEMDWHKLVDSLDLSPREKDEALEELERVNRALASSQPDWDRIKRSLKFILDFDRTLAIRTLPHILNKLK